jgi:hypothetical protein
MMIRFEFRLCCFPQDTIEARLRTKERRPVFFSVFFSSFLPPLPPLFFGPDAGSSGAGGALHRIPTHIHHYRRAPAHWYLDGFGFHAPNQSCKTKKAQKAFERLGVSIRRFCRSIGKKATKRALSLVHSQTDTHANRRASHTTHELNRAPPHPASLRPHA